MKKELLNFKRLSGLITESEQKNAILILENLETKIEPKDIRTKVDLAKYLYQTSMALKNSDLKLDTKQIEYISQIISSALAGDVSKTQYSQAKQKLNPVREEIEKINFKPENTTIKIAKMNWNNKGDILLTDEGDVIFDEREKNTFLVFINGNKIYYARNLNTDKLVEIDPNSITLIKNYEITNDEDVKALELFNKKLSKEGVTKASIKSQFTKF